MQFICNQKELNEKLKLVSKATTEKGAISILENLLLEIKENSNLLKLSATNLEFGIETNLKIKTIKKGKVCLPAKILSKLIDNFDSEEISFHIKNQAEITSNSSIYKLNISDPEEYPILPKIPEIKPIILPEEQLKRTLKMILRAGKESEYGILIKLEPNSIKFVTTDGIVLAEKTITKSLPKNSQMKINLDFTTVSELEKLLKESKEEIKIYIDKSKIFFQCENFLFYSSLLNREFPNYKDFIPTSENKFFKFNKEEFLTKLKRTKLISSSVRLITNDKKNLILKSGSPNLGEGTESIEKGEIPLQIEIQFTSDRLIDIVEAINENEVNFEFFGKEKPIIFTPTLKWEESFLFMIMPIVDLEEEILQEIVEEPPELDFANIPE